MFSGGVLQTFYLARRRLRRGCKTGTTAQQVPAAYSLALLNSIHDFIYCESIEHVSPKWLSFRLLSPRGCKSVQILGIILDSRDGPFRKAAYGEDVSIIAQHINSFG